MSRKRRRDITAVDAHLVEIYEDLANVDEAIRLKAARDLLINFISKGKDAQDQIIEILRRLIRGLCSGRKAARLGFSIALTETLTELFGPNKGDKQGFLGIPELLETLQKQTQVTGNVYGQEERDHQFGRLFGADSIIKSGILFQPNAEIEPWTQILGIVYDLAKKKPLLREECGIIIFNSVRLLPIQPSTFAQQIIDKLQQNGLTRTPEGVAIWIETRHKYPTLTFPSGVWHHQEPLNRKETPRIAEVLKQASVADHSNNDHVSKHSQTGNWNSKLHFLWDVILASLLDTTKTDIIEKSKRTKKTDFASFWEECVDNTLFATSSSEERKYWGFLLFQKMIRDAPINVMPSLFSRNLIRSLMNQLASPDRYLHRAADKAIKEIFARVRLNPNVKVPVLRGLLANPHEDRSFDKITKTKTIETLLSPLDDNAFEAVLDLYEESLSVPGVQEEKRAAERREAMADQLLAAARSVQFPPSQGLIEMESRLANVKRILTLLMKYAYFDMESVPNDLSSKLNPPVSSTLRKTLRSKITSCLTDLAAKPPAVLSAIAYVLVSEIYRDGDNEKSPKTVLDFDGAVHETLRKAWDRLRKAKRMADKASPGSSERAFFESVKLLYSFALLQAYNEDNEAVNILDELNDCHWTLNGKQGPKESYTLVENLLSLLAKPSKLFRHVALQVFAGCAYTLCETDLQSMVNILDTKENVSGQAEVFDQEDREIGADEASVVEEIDVSNLGSNSPANELEDTDTESSPENSLDDQSDGPDEELAAFDVKLAQALGTRPGNQDAEAEDSSSSDQDMDDEQMEALDEYLAKVFRERKKVTNMKNEKKDAKESVINFKRRVLDLLEIYIKQQIAGSLTLKLLLPLLKVIRITTSPEISQKAYDVMRKYTQLCKGGNVPKIENANDIFHLLQDVHGEAMKQCSNAHASACSQASLLLVRVLAFHDRENLRRVVKVYGNTQEKVLFDSGCKVKTSFFTDWQNWCTSA